MAKPELLYTALLTERLLELNDLEGLKAINKELLEELRTERARVKSTISRNNE